MRLVLLRGQIAQSEETDERSTNDSIHLGLEPISNESESIMSRTARSVPHAAILAARERHHSEIVDALRDGRKQRAVKFTNRKREASRQACRGKIY